MSLELSDAERATTKRSPAGPAPRARRRRGALFSTLATVALIVLLALVLELAVLLGVWNAADLPPPSAVLSELRVLAVDPQFWADLGRTGFEVAVSVVLGALLGLVLGVAFWKLPRIGRAFEPYLVSFYAVPLVLFYPVMIVLVGINAGSVIILASIMAMIPMALNTTVGLNGIPPVYLKLARSVAASPRQTLFSVAIPAAAPYIGAGLRLCVVYALIGAIAMEFTTAQAGLGFRIRYLYETFDSTQMFAYIFVVLVLSCLLTLLLQAADRLLLRGGRR